MSENRIIIELIKVKTEIINQANYYRDDIVEVSINLLNSLIIFFQNLKLRWHKVIQDSLVDILLSYLDPFTSPELHVGNKERNTVAFVKMRLSGKASELITTESMIEQIREKLNANIKGDRSRNLANQIQSPTKK